MDVVHVNLNAKIPRKKHIMHFIWKEKKFSPPGKKNMQSNRF